ncbi:hypothetical protein JXB41_08485 [Candidatus Woesearchaeota archaeon]|nr:hypothetical protein [Candidatus Woesearchaeota archaeon]
MGDEEDLIELFRIGFNANRILENAIKGSQINIDLGQIKHQVYRYLQIAIETLSKEPFNEQYSQILEYFSKSRTAFEQFLRIGNPYAQGAADYFISGRTLFFRAYQTLKAVVEKLTKSSNT